MLHLFLTPTFPSFLFKISTPSNIVDGRHTPFPFFHVKSVGHTPFGVGFRIFYWSMLCLQNVTDCVAEAVLPSWRVFQGMGWEFCMIGWGCSEMCWVYPRVALLHCKCRRRDQFSSDFRWVWNRKVTIICVMFKNIIIMCISVTVCSV